MCLPDTRVPPRTHMVRCHWSWKRFRCLATTPAPPPLSMVDSLALHNPKHVLKSLFDSFYTALDDPNFIWCAVVALVTLIFVLLVSRKLSQSRPGLLRTIYRLVVCRGRHLPGVLTGVVFPIHAGELSPKVLTAMLRQGGHLGSGTCVIAVRDRLTKVRDGVKGDKAIIDVEYGRWSGGCAVPPPAGLPTTFFVKFSIQKLSAMRLLCESTEVSACEALFYTHLAGECRELGILPTPRCFFVDYNEVSGEFVLLSELMPFGEGTGEGAILPLKHRVRDSPSLDEQRLFVAAGAKLNAQYWGESALLRGCLRFDATHARAWTIMQVLSYVGLHHTARKALKGRPIPNSNGFVSWSPPEELVGKEGALIRDMPHILTSLCEESEMIAFGHNDIVTDNAYFVRATGGMPQDGAASFGLFDWQQSSVNSVGQEWAWNWHWLPPDFLTKHEDELIDLLLKTVRRPRGCGRAHMSSRPRAAAGAQPAQQANPRGSIAAASKSA